MTARLRAGAGAALLLAGVAGCGLPEDRQPRPLGAEEVPLDLSEVNPPGATAEEGDDRVRLWFVRDGVLRAVVRAAPEQSVATAIELLLAGPLPDESALSNLVPSETVLNEVELVEDGTAFLDLGCIEGTEPGSCGLLAIGGADQLTAFAQLACTATEVDGVEAVRFLQEGEPQDAPTDTGTAQGAVTCGDYASLLPPGTG